MKEKLETRRQDLKPEAFITGFNLQCRKFILKKIRYQSKISIPYILPDSRFINIDNSDDFVLAGIN